MSSSLPIFYFRPSTFNSEYPCFITSLICHNLSYFINNGIALVTTISGTSHVIVNHFAYLPSVATSKSCDNLFVTLRLVIKVTCDITKNSFKQTKSIN